MPIPIIIYGSLAFVTLMGASLGSYQSSRASTLYPPGYETSLDLVTGPRITAPAAIKFPSFQDAVVYGLLLTALRSNTIPIENAQVNSVIDSLDEEIGPAPDTAEAIALLKKEIANIQTYHIDHYQLDLDRIANNQPQITKYSKTELEQRLANSQEEIRLLKYDLAIGEARGRRGLLPDEKGFITLTAAERLVKVKAEQQERTKKCECTIARHINKRTFRRNMSDLSAEYQATLSGASWARTENPITNKMSVEIGEWLYDGPAGNADFDGWLKTFCLLLEMKANYDSLMFSRSTFSVINAQPQLKKIGRDKLAAFVKQAQKHNQICEAHKPTARCCWIFMTQHAYNKFITVIGDLPAITAIYVPLDKALL